MSGPWSAPYSRGSLCLFRILTLVSSDSKQHFNVLGKRPGDRSHGHLFGILAPSRARRQEKNKGVGKTKVSGPFSGRRAHRRNAAYSFGRRINASATSRSSV